MAPKLFFLLLILVAAYAFWRGSRDERIVAAVCVGGAAASLMVLSPLAIRWQSLELGTLLVDLAVLAGFVTVAMRSQRFWPLWVAGLQLTTTIGHVLKGVDPNLLPQAYGAALQFWSYPILLILAVGTWRSYGRRKAERHVALPA
ncbi:hypothetical protein [Sphingomonas mesophila]|uniref:hypothetical protein n=1 Tax=Sphingomonas mesophila TaxID=2303576 RepID=UPI000E588735|nr:hypothetical protein [Sphingomonas mesophila]